MKTQNPKLCFVTTDGELIKTHMEEVVQITPLDDDAEWVLDNKHYEVILADGRIFEIELYECDGNAIEFVYDYFVPV